MIDVSKLPGYKSLIGRLLRLPLSAVPSSAVVRILQGPLRGMRWIAGSGIHRLWLGSYEVEKMKSATALLREGQIAFDIGANVGIYTLLFSRLVGPSGHVTAFEPSRRNVEFLRKHLSLNSVTNVSVVEAAVASTVGLARFDSAENSSTGHLSAAGTIEVPTVTVDEYVSQSGKHPTIMKVDVEGGEVEVLRGSVNTLRRHRPVVLLATHSAVLKNDCLEFLSSCGYGVMELDGADGSFSDELVAKPRSI